MATTTEEPAVNLPKNKIADLVGENVIKKLGTPPDFFKTKAMNVFGSWYRVNVYIHLDSEERIVKRSSISYSYLVESDKTGNILNSKPEIIKQFE